MGNFIEVSYQACIKGPFEGELHLSKFVGCYYPPPQNLQHSYHHPSVWGLGSRGLLKLGMPFLGMVPIVRIII